MPHIVGFILFAEAEGQACRDLFSEEVARGEILVRIIQPNEILSAAEELIRAGAQALVTRGGSYYQLQEKSLPVPLVGLTIGAQDILPVLSRVIDRYDDIWLVLSDWVNFDFARCRALFPPKVHCFCYSPVDEMQDFLERLDAPGRTLVIGGGFTLAPAAARGFDAVQLFSSADSLRESYETALHILRERDKEAAKAQQFATILANVEDGVVVLDEKNRVTLCNRKAEELLERSSRSLTGRELCRSLPQFVPVHKAYSAGKRSEQLVRTDSHILSVRIAPVTDLAGDLPVGGTLLTLRDVTKLQELEKNLRFQLSRRGLTARYHFDDILTQEDSMRRLIRWAQDCAQSDNTVMIYGESGTGKELFAQSIHNASARRDCPFVAVNCAALTESLLESELFGYEAGAFTGARKDGRPGLFELAHRGTLFLDEINSMSLSTQAKILRVIEQKEVMRLGSDYVIPLDVRIITAANENLVEMVHRNTFRRDLFFRLNVLEVRIPPLDQRPRDILHLFRHYLARFRGLSEDAVTLSPPLEQALLAHRWWGNVRELRNVAQRYAVRGDGTDTLEVLFPEGSGTAEDPVVGDDLRVDLKALNRTVEGLVIQSLLDRGLTKAQTAKALGISRTALFKKLEEQREEK